MEREGNKQDSCFHASRGYAKEELKFFSRFGMALSCNNHSSNTSLLSGIMDEAPNEGYGSEDDLARIYRDAGQGIVFVTPLQLAQLYRQSLTTTPSATSESTTTSRR